MKRIGQQLGFQDFNFLQPVDISLSAFQETKTFAGHTHSNEFLKSFVFDTHIFNWIQLRNAFREALLHFHNRFENVVSLLSRLQIHGKEKSDVADTIQSGQSNRYNLRENRMI